MKTVSMFGPSISDPTKIVNREVPENDVQAYINAGYKKGSTVEEKVETAEPVAEKKMAPKKAKK